jgi:hypothetical protein
MTILDIWKFRDACLNPVVNGYLSARRTETRFAGVWDFFCFATLWAFVLVKSEIVSLALKNSINIVMDSRADMSFILNSKIVPIVVILEYLLD